MYAFKKARIKPVPCPRMPWTRSRAPRPCRARRPTRQGEGL